MYELYDYQNEILDWMNDIETQIETNPKYLLDVNNLSGGILILEMGLGKTLISLEHIKRQRGTNLVIMSKTLLANWQQEIMKFNIDDELNILYMHKDFSPFIDVLSYNEMMEYDIVLTTYEVVMASYNLCIEDIRMSLYEIGNQGIHKNKIVGYRNRKKPNIDNIEDYIGKELLHRIPWDRIICDESQRFANIKTKTFKSVHGLYGKYKWCLTGTPIRNSYKDIWAQLKFCGYKSMSPRNFNNSNYNKISNTYRLKKKDVHKPLPQLHKHTEILEMDLMHKKIYIAYAENLRDKIEEYELKLCGFSCILEAFLRLRQVSVSPYILSGGKYEDKLLKTTKLRRIMEIIHNNMDKKIIVFSMYEGMFGCLELMLDVSYIKITGAVSNAKTRSELLHQFRTTDINVLLLNYKIGSEGLNITEANIVICIEPWWNDAVHSQAIARVHRNGQTKEVDAYFILSQHTIEESIINMCEEKKSQSQNLLKKNNKMNSITGVNLGTIKKMLEETL